MFYLKKSILLVLLLSCSASKSEEIIDLNNSLSSQESNENELQENENNQQFNEEELDEQQQFNEQEFNEQEFNEEEQLSNQNLLQEVEDIQGEMEQLNDIDNQGFGQQNVESDIQQQLLDEQAKAAQDNFSGEFEDTESLQQNQLYQQNQDVSSSENFGETADNNYLDSMETTETDASYSEKKMGLVYWIGYIYKQNESAVNIEVVTKNSPQFDIYQELNKANQREIVIRFYDSEIRRKLKRDINSSEFRSPIAYIRSRIQEGNIAEVILTLRDEVIGKFFAQENGILLSFPIPKKYFDAGGIGDDPIEQATDLSNPIEIEPVDNTMLPRAGKILGYAFNREVFDNVDPNSMQLIPENSASDVLNNSLQEENVIEENNVSLNTENENFNNQNFQQNNQQLQQNNNFQQSNDFQQNNQQLQQSNDFQQNEQENNFEDENYNQTSSGSEIIFLQVGQDPADDFSSPKNLTNGNVSGENDPEENTQLLEESVNDNGANETLENEGDNSSEDEKLGEIEENMNEEAEENSNENNFTNNIEAEELLPPLHGTEYLGQEKTSEDGIKSSKKAVRMSFRNAPLSEVLHAFRMETGTNFIYPPDVGAMPIMMNLTDIPWDDALLALLEVNNFGKVKIGENLVRIDRISAISEYKKSLQDFRIQESRLEPTKIMIFRLSYARASQVKGMISSLLGSIIKRDDRIQVEIDDRTNSLLIEALPNDLAKIRILIERLDYQTPQVRIASRIVEILSSNDKIFGINWSGPINYDQSRGLGFGSLLFPNYITASYAIDAGAPQSGEGGGSGIGIHFGSLNDSISLDLRLQMDEIRGSSEILQTNNVVVQDRQQAVISVGTTDYFLVTSESGSEVEQISYNVSLSVTPEITADHSVQMQINVSSSNPTRAGAGDTSSANRTITTRLLKKSGETIAIGGLYTANKTKGSRGIPILSSIPIIGALFKSHSSAQSKRELVVLVTPTIVESGKTDLDMASNNLNNEDDFNNENNFQQNNQFQFQQNNQNFGNENINDISSNENVEGNNEWQNNNQNFQQQQGQQQNNLTQGFGSNQSDDQQQFGDDQQQFGDNQQQFDDNQQFDDLDDENIDLQNNQDIDLQQNSLNQQQEQNFQQQQGNLGNDF